MTYIPNPTRYDHMIYRPAGNSGLLLPALSLGLWHNCGSVDDFENARDMIHTAFDLGITHFDLANNYGPEPGSAERNFGRILKEDFQKLRDELIISTKAGYPMWPGPYGNWGSKKSLLASLDQSLERLGLDYVDIFYSHRPDPNTPIEETMGALKSALDSGKALYVGLSNYSAKETEAAVLAAEKLGFKLLIHQPRYSMLDRWIEDDLQETLTEAGIGTIAFKPLYQGLLTEKYLHGIPEDSRMRDPHYATLHDDSLTKERLEQVQALNDLAQSRGQSLAQMALAWVLRERDDKVQGITSALIGASRPQQIIENVAALEHLKFTDEELIKIEKLL
ncbi:MULTISPECIES: L-glyceraldehyde 3-phosphate reductase [Lactococcus]|uniref:L-glyceraldehyde 3-phosphate reductase n=1 Tax=Lactococcus TaxID=1357 RepID=UPI00071D56D4|nr:MULTISPECIES: L-glyceraldehyde 3-phosphate reductase [Lactococcus]KAF6609441.1 L-glyceraldehyde 3-phosphate reductase [Lactococcus sp. EKM201L]KAF6612371.1 L-glyceraldehyde 3-phosphate reductase [Lactococcus sp. EKM203L]KAF6641636.1 L-glyceraldehyde 3-phosphate reductase [Lactococcus sp. EKM501L]KAF6644641.1 L-glyceraldehyde 3-phosphate reductase [Lactococcus sp. EKM502L]KAF6652149.1 L-glyceraldehyde 3-phosphate reductase [Lactococcus sp. EKM101L]